jgi:hypothetical protein
MSMIYARNYRYDTIQKIADKYNLSEAELAMRASVLSKYLFFIFLQVI